MKLKSLTICPFLLLMLTFIISTPVLAVGLTVRPTSINIEIAKGKTAESELLIINSYNEPATYRVFADDFSEKIIVTPSRFKLYPGENQIVKVALAGNGLTQKSTNISVVASPLGGVGLITSSGVKIPLTIAAPNRHLIILLLTSLIFAACFIVLFVVKLRKKKQDWRA